MRPRASLALVLIIVLKAFIVPVHAAGGPEPLPAQQGGSEAECPMHLAEQVDQQDESCACPGGGCCVINAERYAHPGFQIHSCEMEPEPAQFAVGLTTSGSDSPLSAYASRAPPIHSLS